MKNKLGRSVSLSLIALVLIAAMIVPFTSAEDMQKIDVSSVINTTTDKTQVNAPFASVIETVQGSVVGVNNYQDYSYSTARSFYSRGERKTVEQLASTGSGVVIYDKYVLTNYHVVEDAKRVSISVLGSEEEIAGSVVGFDDSIDIAIIYAEELSLPAAPLGDSDQLQVGEWAICIGNPLSEELRGTVTVGIVSALDRKIDSTTVTDKYGLKTTVTNQMIQTDAAINSGNSGGGMFNVLGQLMGIPTMKYSGSRYSGATIEGIGLAIPVNSAKPLIESVLTKGFTGENLHANEKKQDAENTPSSEKPRLGVSVSTLSPSNSYEVNAGLLPSGAMITVVEEGSPAEKAGLQNRDIIVEANGTIITGVTELSNVLAQANVGDTILIKAYRVEGLAEAETVEDIQNGEYIDFEVVMTDYR